MKNSIKLQFENEINMKKKEYGDCLTQDMGMEEVLEIGTRWYEDVNAINEAYHMIPDPSSLDDMNAYYIACDILCKVPVKNLFPQKEGKDDVDDIEKYKVRLSNAIYRSCAG